MLSICEVCGNKEYDILWKTNHICTDCIFTYSLYFCEEGESFIAKDCIEHKEELKNMRLILDFLGINVIDA